MPFTYNRDAYQLPIADTNLTTNQRPTPSLSLFTWNVWKETLVLTYFIHYFNATLASHRAQALFLINTASATNTNQCPDYIFSMWNF